ncbi:MAG TPA: serine/threonine-protein kinase [Actinomycetales bacterium]|nr:serine/threonine-protein kinase [Actinomycetales bacterium]
MPENPAKAPQVPGYTTGRLLGFGGAGEVWSATDDTTGARVALKLLNVGAESAQRVLRESTLLRRIEHPHVVRLRAVVQMDERSLALVLDHAPGGTLTALVGTRGALDPGEVVTILSPLAGALADLHARGVVHADVTPGNVLFAEDGRPLLSDLGIASLIGLHDGDRHGTPGYTDPVVLAGAGPTPATDVYGLCATGWFALTGRAPQPAGTRPPLIPLAPHTPAELAALVERGLDPSQHRRPGAAQLAVRFFDAAPAAPVRLVPTDPGAAAAEVVTHRLRSQAPPAQDLRDDDTHPSRRRRLALASGAVALLLGGAAAVAVGVGALRADEGTVRAAAPTRSLGTTAPTPSGSATAAGTPSAATVPARPTPTRPPGVPQEVLDVMAAPAPEQALVALADLRATAFATGRREPLELANVRQSPSLAADVAIFEALEHQGIRLKDLTFDIVAVDTVSRSADEAVLAVEVVTGRHQRVRVEDGSVVDEQPASAPQASRLTLRRVDGLWRVSDVS